MWLVTGGAGYIGAHVVRRLRAAGYAVAVLDDLSTGRADRVPPGVPLVVAHVADRRWETKDSQTLLGDLVDAGVSDPSRLAASGGSYGGGQSWLLATSMPWKSAKGATLQLAAAVPHYPWTDLLYSLAPNGRENDDPPERILGPRREEPRHQGLGELRAQRP